MAEIRRALIVATSEYKDSSFSPLSSPVEDAKELRRVLKDPAIGDFNVTTFLNKKTQTIRKAIEDFFVIAPTKPNDLLLFYFSGHGIMDANGIFHFATADTELAHGVLRGSTAIDEFFFRSIAGRSRSARQVIILDCCYSGALAIGMRPKGGAQLNPGAHLAEQGKGRIVLASSTERQRSYESSDSDEPQPSVYTKIFIDGLETGAADADGVGEIDVDNLYAYIVRRMKDEAPHQCPTKNGNIEGKLYIARTAKRNVSPALAPSTIANNLPAQSPAIHEGPDFFTRNGVVVQLTKPLAIGKDIVSATRSFEEWLGRYVELSRNELRLKHANMTHGVYPFFRATFYRWVRMWPKICSDQADAPTLLAVGDIHVENFATWRDVHGRLIWGISDFDEAAAMPFTSDLIRLAVSARLAIEKLQIGLKGKDVCVAILSGYREALRAQGLPFVLEEKHVWLRELVQLRDPHRFWARMDSLPTIRTDVPKGARPVEELFPQRSMPYRWVSRVAGLGSIGRSRLVALTEFAGGRIAVEAKALMPPSLYWAQAVTGPAELVYRKIITHAVRCADHYVRLRDGWLFRRLSPDCSRVELASLPTSQFDLRLLHAMGWETGNIHLGSGEVWKEILRYLDRQGSNWLSAVSKAMTECIKADWQEWRKSGWH